MFNGQILCTQFEMTSIYYLTTKLNPSAIKYQSLGYDCIIRQVILRLSSYHPCHTDTLSNPSECLSNIWLEIYIPLYFKQVRNECVRDIWC
jgi:hypothetical protein